MVLCWNGRYILGGESKAYSHAKEKSREGDYIAGLGSVISWKQYAICVNRENDEKDCPEEVGKYVHCARFSATWVGLTGEDVPVSLWIYLKLRRER